MEGKVISLKGSARLAGKPQKSTNLEVDHAGDCSIYSLNCHICDCGEFRRIMGEIDILDAKTIELLLRHQWQITSLKDL